MNTLSLNLLYQPKKKYWAITLGVILILSSLSSFFFRDSLQPWMIIQVISFLIYGSYLTSLGMGYNPEGILGNAYINVNDELIHYKPEPLKKDLQITWSNVSSIEIKQISILFTLKNNSEIELKYLNLDYNYIQQLKSAIKTYGTHKNIPIH